MDAFIFAFRVAGCFRLLHNRLLERTFPVKIEVQLPHVDARLALETQLSICRVLSDELVNFIAAHATFSSNARQLRLGRGGRDMRVKARSGGGYQINWYGLPGILRLQRSGALPHASISLWFVDPRFVPPEFARIFH